MARSGRALGRALAGGLAAAPPQRTAAVRYAGRGEARRSDRGGDSQGPAAPPPTAAESGMPSRGTASGRPGSPPHAGRPRCIAGAEVGAGTGAGVGPPEAPGVLVRSRVNGPGGPAARGAVLGEPLSGSPRPGECGACPVLPRREGGGLGEGEREGTASFPPAPRFAGAAEVPSTSVAVGSVSVKEQTIFRL